MSIIDSLEAQAFAEQTACLTYIHKLEQEINDLEARINRALEIFDNASLLTPKNLGRQMKDALEGKT